MTCAVVSYAAASSFTTKLSPAFEDQDAFEDFQKLLKIGAVLIGLIIDLGIILSCITLLSLQYYQVINLPNLLQVSISFALIDVCLFIGMAAGYLKDRIKEARPSAWAFLHRWLPCSSFK